MLFNLKSSPKHIFTDLNNKTSTSSIVNNDTKPLYKRKLSRHEKLAAIIANKNLKFSSGTSKPENDLTSCYPSLISKLSLFDIDNQKDNTNTQNIPINPNNKKNNTPEENKYLLKDKINFLLNCSLDEEKYGETCEEYLNIFFKNSMYLIENDNKIITKEISQRMKICISLIGLTVLTAYVLSKKNNKEFKNQKAVKDDLNILLQNNMQLVDLINNFNENNKNENFKILLLNLKKFSDLEENILNNYTNPQNKIDEEIKTLFKNIRNITIDDINKFYSNTFKIIKDNLESKEEEDEQLTNSSTACSTPSLKFTYLIPFPPSKQSTLVLDMDETLVHVSNITNKVTYRPGLYVFLNHLLPYFELIIFTTSVQSYADEVLDFIEEKNKFFSYRLYRQHAQCIGNKYIKNLSKLGRDLNRIIIIDDKPTSFQFQPGNGILIRPYIIDERGKVESDFVLYDLERVLLRIIKEDNGDLRDGIKRYKDEITNKISF